MRLPIVTPVDGDRGQQRVARAGLDLLVTRVFKPEPPRVRLEGPTLFRAPRRWKVGSGIRRGYFLPIRFFTMNSSRPS
jgi:hypothetical protein